MLSELGRAYFQCLIEKAQKIADALDDPMVGGVKSSVVEKYSDQAHFICTSSNLICQLAPF